MKELVQQFIKEYIENYHLDLNEEKDVKELKLAIETIECQECLSFLEKHHINIANYPKFRDNLIKECREQLKVARNNIAKNKFYQKFDELMKNVEVEMIYRKGDTHLKELIAFTKKNFEKLSEVQKNKIFQIYVDYMNSKMQTKKMTLDELKAWIFHFWSNYRFSEEWIKIVTSLYQKTEELKNINYIEKTLNDLLEINEEVKIQNQMLKAQISGYVISNHTETKIVTTKAELERYLQIGYYFNSYQVKQKFLGRTKVKEVEAKEIKKKPKKSKKWKRLAFAAALGAIFLGAKSCTNQKEEEIIPMETDYLHDKTLPRRNNDQEVKEQIFTPTSKRAYQRTIIIEEKKTKEEEELEEILNSIPASDAKYTITSDAKVHTDLSKLDKNASKPFYQEGTIKQNSGYVLIDEFGVQHIISDPVLTRDLVLNGNYEYVGTRAINENSFDANGNIIGYEGLYSKDEMILLDGQETLYEELESQGKARVLTK